MASIVVVGQTLKRGAKFAAPVQREPVQRDDLFPGQLVGGTPAHGV